MKLVLRLFFIYSSWNILAIVEIEIYDIHLSLQILYSTGFLYFLFFFFWNYYSINAAFSFITHISSLLQGHFLIFFILLQFAISSDLPSWAFFVCLFFPNKDKFIKGMPENFNNSLVHFLYNLALSISQ